MGHLRTQPLNRELNETRPSLFQLAGADGDRASVWWLHSSPFPLDNSPCHCHTGRLSHACLQEAGKSEGFYAGRGLNEQLVEVGGGEARPSACQVPMTRANRSEEPKTEVFNFAPLSSIVTMCLQMNSL